MDTRSHADVTPSGDNDDHQLVQDFQRRLPMYRHSVCYRWFLLIAILCLVWLTGCRTRVETSVLTTPVRSTITSSASTGEATVNAPASPTTTTTVRPDETVQTTA